MRTAWLALLAGLVPAVPGTAVAAEPLQIAHDPVHCMQAERYPVISACVEPAQRVARVQALFRSDAGEGLHSIELKPVGSCYRGVLPQPRSTTRSVRYSLVATDVLSGVARTAETVAEVVTDERACQNGPLGPFLSSASVVVAGGGLPVGFVGGPAAGHGSSRRAAVVVGGGAVVAGALLAGRAGGSPAGGTGGTGGTSVTTTPDTTVAPALPPPPPTTTTTTVAPAPTTTTRPPSPTTTTTTTTTLPQSGCGADSSDPTVSIQSPAANADVGATVAIVVQARDPGPVSNGIRQVRLTAQETGGGRSLTIATLTGTGPGYTTTWTLPACTGSQDRWDITAIATDNCDRSASDTVRVRRMQSTCRIQQAADGSRVVWTSELDVPGGRGQLTTDGGDLAFVPERRSTFALPAAPRGASRVEALLVDARGAGVWRFSVASGGIRAGSLQVLAGELAGLENDAIVFRLRGRPGERVVFTFLPGTAPRDE